MSDTARNRLLVLGALWGLVLAALPAFVMAQPFEVSAFLAAAVGGAVVSGVAATLYAGLRASRKKRGGVLAGIITGLFQGLVGGVFGAIFIWGLMAVSLSGFTLSNLMRPSVFIGSFFVALSAFLYALLGGVLLGPVFGVLVNRAAGNEAKTGIEKGES